MGLTEPQCGTDLGLIRTRAEPTTDRNAVSCGSIEHKMGYNASPTCVMNFDGARGWLVGEPHSGLKAMFTLMNNARIGSGIQALGLTDASFQGALKYARERLQMRALSGAKNPDGPADPILVHPSLRQLLLTQKAITEGCRALIYEGARLSDLASRAADPEVRRHANGELGFLTPIIQGFITEVCYECTYHGLQVFGGHGYVREQGMEQLMRDCRIATIYEGTTQVQALDLLGRKTLMSQGKPLARYAEQLLTFCNEHQHHPLLQTQVAQLKTLVQQWQELTHDAMSRCWQNLEELGAASVDYLMYSGYIVVSYWWTKQALAALRGAVEGEPLSPFCEAKIQTCQFWFARILPRTLSHKENILAGAQSLMAMSKGFRVDA